VVGGCALGLAFAAPAMAAPAVIPQPPGVAVPLSEAFVEPDPIEGVGPLRWRAVYTRAGGGTRTVGVNGALQGLVFGSSRTWRGKTTVNIRGALITSGEVAAISVNGGPPIPTVALEGLPVPAAIVVYEVVGATTVRRTPPSVKYTFLDATGAPLPRPVITPEPPIAPGTWTWMGPSQSLQGVCTITASPFPGLVSTSGTVVTQLRHLAYEGEVDTVCAATLYTYNGGEPLEAFMVVDAAHLGTRPGPLPGLVPLTGSTALVSRYAPDGVAAAATNAGWLLVRGGRDQTQRLSLLSHLSGTLEGEKPRPRRHHRHHHAPHHHA